MEVELGNQQLTVPLNESPIAMGQVSLRMGWGRDLHNCFDQEVLMEVNIFVFFFYSSLHYFRKLKCKQLVI